MFSNTWNNIIEWFRDRSERAKLVRSFNESARNAQPYVAQLQSMRVLEPSFGSPSDIFSGFTICIDSLHGNKVEILSYSRIGNSYSGTMRITYYDHFGLDLNDVAGGYPGSFANFGVSNLYGFRHWFILQHWNGLGTAVRPKPFITTMEFNASFSGSIQ